MPIEPNSLVTHILRRWHWLIAILITILIWAFVALTMMPVADSDGSYATQPYGLTTSLENKSVDLLFQLRDSRLPHVRARGFSEPITIIDIDEASIRASNIRLQKWPRDFYARLIDRASEDGAIVIGLDTFLSEEGGRSNEDKEGDLKLARSIVEAGNVVLAMKTASGGFPEIRPLPIFSEGAYATGFVDLPLDTDSFVRTSKLVQTTPGQETQLSFATRIVEGYLASLTAEGATPPTLQFGADGKVRLTDRVFPMRNDRNLQLDFRARTPAFTRISAGDILFNGPNAVHAEAFRDRIVLIGTSNIDAPDLFPTPFYETGALPRLLDRNLDSAPRRTPGVEIHATAAATMLFGNMLTRPRFGWQIVVVLLFLALAGLAVFYLRVSFALVSVILIAVAVLVISSWSFNSRGLILPLSSTWVGLTLLTPIGMAVRYARERILRSESDAERALVMDIFSRFVSKEVAVQMWEKRGQLSLAGERRIITAIFTDIRNFTTLSEPVSSATVVEWLNDYFGRMHKVVESYGGHINKFIGDGLMIVFGAPVDRGDREEARAAVDCGIAMLAEVERLNKDWVNTGRPVIKIGVGIHTGEATCGVVGAERRLEYTLIGDTINLTARLESTTKELGVSLLVSDTTAAFLGDDYEVRPMGEVKVKGKTINTKVFTVTHKEKSAPSVEGSSGK